MGAWVGNPLSSNRKCSLPSEPPKAFRAVVTSLRLDIALKGEYWVLKQELKYSSGVESTSEFLKNALKFKLILRWTNQPSAPGNSFRYQFYLVVVKFLDSYLACKTINLY